MKKVNVLSKNGQNITISAVLNALKDLRRARGTPLSSLRTPAAALRSKGRVYARKLVAGATMIRDRTDSGCCTRRLDNAS